MTTNEPNKRNGARLALSRKETADILGITPVTIDRLTKRGLLNPSRATRRPLYPIWEIERFLRDTSQSIELDNLNTSESKQEELPPPAGEVRS